MRYFFTADTHFGHGNIVKYANRTIFMSKEELKLHKEEIPFKVSRESQDRMNRELIRRWNERVKDDDIVIFNGDFCFKSGVNRGEGEPLKADYWIKQLKGNKIFIRGNHDRNNSLKTNILNLVIEIAKKKIFIVHNPEHFNPSYKINFVAHVHDNWLFQWRKGSILINIGVDQWDYYPVRWEDIVQGMIKKTGINLYKF